MTMIIINVATSYYINCLFKDQYSKVNFLGFTRRFFLLIIWFWFAFFYCLVGENRCYVVTGKNV